MKTEKLKPVLLATAIVTALCAQTAAGQEVRDFSLPSADLRTTLPRFASQAGVQVVAPDENLDAIPTPRIAGRMPVRAALAMLLDGTGINIASDDGQTITLRVPPATQVPVAAPTPTPAPVEPDTLAKVEVVGSQIKGMAAAEALLPVVGISAEQIDAVGAVSGDDLYRSIPQMGDVTFRNGFGGNSSNFARGDIASVNLRGLGAGNTLLLINGRRIVVHPTSQADEQLVPVLTYNANVIPVANLRRVEVLLNGASAIYGTDAVAGVVNNVLRDDVDGGSLQVQYGLGEGTGLRDRNVNGVWGRNFAQMRGNFTLAYNWQHSTGLNAWDQAWTATSLRWFDFAGTEFADANALDFRSTTTRWGNFTARHSGVIRANGVAATTAAGLFHVQPGSYPACGPMISTDVCVASGSLATAGADRDLRWDAGKMHPISFAPEYNRLNLFATGKYEFGNGIELFTELGWYRSRSRSLQQPVNSIASLPAMVAASGYWNPFGARYLPDGSLNPNRLPGLNIPDAGVDVLIRNYRFDVPTLIKVDNLQTRLLAGLRGTHGAWDWESALLYARASVVDSQNAVSASLLEAAMAKPTADAYNPFGGNNSAAAIESVMYRAVRESRNTLALWDFKLSRPDLFRWRSGDVGVAAGIEIRRETQLDDRDARVDGSIPWHSLSGTVYPSDMYGVSPTPDTRGARKVAGLHVEFYLPLIGPEQGIPLVRNLDVQIAGRHEYYDDFGSVTKPKVALGWELVEGLALRGSWSQGFRAPNLEQVNASVITRANTRRDYVQCEADLRSGAIARFADCAHSYSTSARRSGNPDLQPETSDNSSAGIVFEPSFLPEQAGRLRLSMDYYKYRQKGIIGLFGEGNALILDYIQRVQGQHNPNVIRAEANADEIARFAGTGLEPAGQVLYVLDQYVNLLPQTVRGLDFGLDWRSPESRAGQFRLQLNGSRILEFHREVSPQMQVMFDAREAGIINAATPITGGGDLLMLNGKPRWKWTGNLIWTKNRLQAGVTARYTGNFHDTALQYPDGRYWAPGSSTYWNLFGKYQFAEDSALAGVSLKLGINNVENRRPPISADASGYLSTLYSATPRYWFLNIGKEF